MNPAFWLAIGLFAVTIAACVCVVKTMNGWWMFATIVSFVLSVIAGAAGIIQVTSEEYRQYTVWCNSKGGTVVYLHNSTLCISPDGRILT